MKIGHKWMDSPSTVKVISHQQAWNKKQGRGLKVVMGVGGFVLFVGRDLREFMASILL